MSGVVDSGGGDPACWADEPAVTGRPRPLTGAETTALLAGDTVARLATLDADGFPHVTPIWFLWDGEAFVLSSLAHRPHVHRLRRDPRAGLVVDAEDGERADGERPNRQIRVTGRAEVLDDEGGAWARRVGEKYLIGPAGRRRVELRARQRRVGILLVPATWVAVASV